MRLLLRLTNEQTHPVYIFVFTFNYGFKTRNQFLKMCNLFEVERLSIYRNMFHHHLHKKDLNILFYNEWPNHSLILL